MFTCISLKHLLNTSVVCRSVFSEYRGRVGSYFKEDRRVLNWEFHPTHAFCRLDAFLHRLDAIKEIFITAREFLKIEKIEFGGTKGKLLGIKMSAVFRLAEVGKN